MQHENQKAAVSMGNAATA